jgi:hypothetical protein
MDSRGVKWYFCGMSCESQKKAGAAVAATLVTTEAASGLTLLAQLVTARRGTGRCGGKLTARKTFFCALAGRLL